MELSAIQKEFIDLLLTTDQPQGRGMLCNTEGFCCLGLWTAHRGHKMVSIGPWDSAIFDNNEWGILSRKLADELGLHGRGGTSITESSLTAMNDRGMPFKQIAEIILQDPSVYFKEQ